MKLEELIEIMSGARDGNEPVASKTLSWNAYQTAKEINDIELVPELESYIENASNESLRGYAFDLLGFIAKNASSKETVEVLVKHVRAEDGNTGNLHKILDALQATDVSLDTGLKDIIYYSFDERDIIRTTAIQVLSLFNIELEKIQETLLEIVAYHYDEYDLKEAVRSLKKLFPDTYKTLLKNQIATLVKSDTDELILKRIKKAAK